MDAAKLIGELTEICSRQAGIIDRLYLELAKLGEAECMGEGFLQEAKEVATELERFKE